MQAVERRIDKLGRIVLPMDFRKALGLEGEAKVSICICDNSISAKGIDTACRLCGSISDVPKDLALCPECVRRIKSSK